MNIFVINTVGSGLDIVSLIHNELKIQGLIGLSEREPGDKISDYVYQKSFCDDMVIDFVEVDSYPLSKPNDKERLISLEIDVLVVAGWQRLLPEWLIDHCKICVIGSHGSPFSITGGRGRSPQNWALILGLKEFFISIFSVDRGIDSGQVIDTRKFKYSAHDDINTSYHKVCLLVADMIIENIKNGKVASRRFIIQEESEAYYFPQRTPEDGYIDWDLNSEVVYNTIRGLTRPYPGAMTKIGNHSIVIYKAIPFSMALRGNPLPGQVVMKFHNGDFLVATHDGFLLVSDYKDDSTLVKSNVVFESFSRTEQLQSIVDRHVSKYPDNRVNKKIIDLIKE